MFEKVLKINHFVSAYIIKEHSANSVTAPTLLHSGVTLTLFVIYIIND